MRIFMALTPSGGHVYPALSLARKLQEACGSEVYFGIPEGAWVKRLEGLGFSSQSIRLKKGLSIRLIYHVYNAMGILREIRPQLVIGFGAYGSLPFLLAAKEIGRAHV